jgi:hypothetical protein
MVNAVFSGNRLCEEGVTIWNLKSESVSVQYLATNMLHQGKDIKKMSTNEPGSVQLRDKDCGL